MNIEMTKAILDDIKNQTRRAVVKFYDLSLAEPKKHPLEYKDMPEDLEFKNFQGFDKLCSVFYSKKEDKHYCSDNVKYNKGETIWVREPAKVISINYGLDIDKMTFEYRADSKIKEIIIPDRMNENIFNYPKWITSCQGIPNGCIKEMARIFLKITNIRVERLQNISWEDAKAEGGRVTYNNSDRCPETGMPASEYETNFINIWNKTAPKGYKWEDNPYVFVYEFEKVEK